LKNCTIKDIQQKKKGATTNPKQIVKDSIRQQFEDYVTEHYGDYEFDPYGWEPDMVTASDSLLDAGFGNDIGEEGYFETLENLVAEIDLDDIKERVMESHLGELDKRRTDARMYQQDKAEDMASMGMSIRTG